MEILWLWLYVILFLVHYQTGFSLNNNDTIRNPLCHEEQRQLLLQFKRQLPREEYKFLWCPERPDNYYKTMFWNKNLDCCLWDGVTCDQSGHVIGLDLNCGGLTGEIHPNSSLFHLSHLRKLNLAYNNFEPSEISSNFGQLNSLTHLNLSLSRFRGQIPVEFYHLSNLVSLDLSLNFHLSCDIKTLFGNMTKIRVLNLLGVLNVPSDMPMNMSSSLTHLNLGFTRVHGNLPESIFEKPNLQILRLRGNDGLKGCFPKSLNWSNVHSIKELDLSGTSISGKLPDSIGFMYHLNYMSLSRCKFWGPIPNTIGNLTLIAEVRLQGNEFSGQVPSTISNLQQLAFLDLSKNHLEGQLPNAFSDLQKLSRLLLNGNYFVGLIPSSLTNMSQLEYLDISSNALTGPFSSIASDGLQKLSTINLCQNLIEGVIPLWLLSLPSLKKLDLSFNRLIGQNGKFNSKQLYSLDLRNNQLEIELESFYNLSNIEELYMSYNTIIEHAHEIVNVTLPSLRILKLSSCKIKEFPHFLRNLPFLNHLDLSNNKIHGPIPSWFTSMPWQNLDYLNLSTNYLTYAEYLPGQQVRFLDLHSNSLRGIFPSSSVCNMSQLILLNLSNNKWRGKISQCIGNSSIQLQVLDLRRNEFHGTIPVTIGGTCDLVSLSLTDNHLEGPLPRSLANCSTLRFLDLGNNKIQDTFPSWLEKLTRLKILILKSNKFHGSIRPPVSNYSFSNLQIIDLSCNNFTGLLPEKLFASLQAMKNLSQARSYGLYMEGAGHRYSVTLSVKGEVVELMVLSIFTTIDLSNNNFHGHIPESLGYLYSLRLLNLSQNSINGSIPLALGYLTNLEQLDLSSNKLTGGIPQTLTNLTFLEVLNLSYNHLAGPIPEARQFSTFSNDSYVGNSGLCGAPLMKKCGNDDLHPSPVEFQEQEDNDSSFMMGFTWEAVVIGYGSGIVLGFILGNVMISMGKPKWFARFYYVEEAICLNRRKKRRRVVQGRR